MEYTVKKLAQLAGVSNRTLRYYDEIGLLKPARINSSGYRIYGQKEVDVLQHILFYRELEIPLEKIKLIMQNPTYDETDALNEHYRMLLEKRKHLDRLLNTVKKTITSKQGGIPMTDQEKFIGFKEKLIEENEEKYGKEIREKYGEAMIDASNEKFRGMTKADLNAMNELGEEISLLLKKAYATGDPASDLAQRLAAKHKQWLMYTWPTYTKEAHAGLAEMYVQDERFTAYYDEIVTGGTVFLRDAILIYSGMKNR